MSLQLLNDDFQLELEAKEKEAKSQPLAGVTKRFRSNPVGSILRGEYPTSQRLEELLLDFD